MKSRGRRWLERVLIFVAGVVAGVFVGVGLCLALGGLIARMVGPMPDEEAPKLWIAHQWARGQCPWDDTAPQDEGLLYVYILAENISEERLEDLAVRATFWFGSHEILGNAEAQADKRVVRPGEVAVWQITAPWKEGMTEDRMALWFTDGSGDWVPHSIRGEPYFYERLRRDTGHQADP